LAAGFSDDRSPVDYAIVSDTCCVRVIENGVRREYNFSAKGMTVLDALASVQNHVQHSLKLHSAQISVLRGTKILTFDLHAMASTTNYALYPGDVIVVEHR
jgi:predicted YcjX-like family ATPase